MILLQFLILVQAVITVVGSHKGVPALALNVTTQWIPSIYEPKTNVTLNVYTWASWKRKMELYRRDRARKREPQVPLDSYREETINQYIWHVHHYR